MAKKFVLFCVVMATCGCTKPKDLAEEALFKINLGFMEDELDLFINQGIVPYNLFNFTVKDGFFYIINASNNRFTKFTSHGDILALMYNANQNPPFSKLNANRQIVEWPFRDPRHIVVDNKNNIYIDDLAPNYQLFENKNQSTPSYSRVVHMFTEKGELLYTLSQHGTGDGDNFPLIEKLYINSKNDLIVVARSLEDWQVFWYTEKGELKYSPVIYKSSATLPDNGDSYFIENITADYNEDKLYLTLNINNETQGINKIMVKGLANPAESTLFNFPGQAEKDDQSYQLIGVDSHSNLFFMATLPINHTVTLYITNNVGKVLDTVLLHGNFWATALASKFYVSPDSILSAIAIDPQSIDVFWWRLNTVIKQAEAASVAR